MKNILLIIIATFCFQQSFCQDILYTKKRGLLKVKVTEVSDAFIKYKLVDLGEDVTYTTTKRNIDSIIFENGMVQRFTKPSRHEAFRSPSRPESLRYHNVNEEIKNSPVNQLSGGVWTFGSIIADGPMGGISSHFKNQFATAVFIRYKTEFLRKRIALNFTPFMALNKEAYGGGIGATFNIKRFGKFTIGVGPEYILSVQDIVEQFHHSSAGSDYFDYYKKYRSAVSIVNFNTNMNLFLKPNLSITADAGVGGVVGSSKRKENKIAPNDGYYGSGTVGSFKLGVGYWF